MAELDNCARCGNVFAKTIRDICYSCYQEEEKAFQLVSQFLRKQQNRRATISQISEGTGVDEDLIIKFVKEKRLQTSQYPNLAYACEKCGNNITEGRLCKDCSDDLIKEVRRVEELEERKINRGHDEKTTIYYTLDKHKKQQ